MWTSERQSSSLSTDVLARFANFKLAGDRAVRDVAETISNVSVASSNAVANAASRGAAFHVRGGVGRRGRRRRARYTSRRHSERRIGVMTDAELEAELAARRAQRARERERYARGMRRDKLQVLEMELNQLRSKIGGGTPANPRWESLGSDGRGRAPSLNASVRREPPGTPMRPPPGSGPPPPPPMGGLRDPNEEEEEIDPEQQKREKAERQRRREQKRKEREANKKPMTLADIIRSAGKNPIARLKPKGSTETVDVNDPQPEVMNEMVNVTLKKAEKKEEGEKENKEESELSMALKKAAKGTDSKEEGKEVDGKQEPNSEEEPQNEEGKEKEGADEKKDDGASEAKDTEPKSDVSPAPEREKEKENSNPESDVAVTADPAKNVGAKNNDASTNGDTSKIADGETSTSAEIKPNAPTPEAEIEPAVEHEKTTTEANGTMAKDSTSANGTIKPQLEDVLSKLAVKKVLMKDTTPSEKNMDSSPDKAPKIVVAEVENKEVEKPKLDKLLKKLAAAKKKSV